MGLIVRTAGAKRTKAEIKRDYDYLVRTWENIRDTTLHSIAPALIYEEEDLVKRAIRDLYDKDIDGIWVEGEAGYKEARDFMRVLMPAQAKKVQAYREPTPLFVRHRIEEHLSQIYSPVVPLKSGGYLVINQTEALVAVDVNSGRATKERNIEATALKTNMEAAEEACRQLRLRDLAGLIVIDFIDMEEAKNNRAVEKRLKDCLKDDRARVQIGKISAFGLMELSRQRRRTGILEGTTHVCPHCQGAGRVRSTEFERPLGAARGRDGGPARRRRDRAARTARGRPLHPERQARLPDAHPPDARALGQRGARRCAGGGRARHRPALQRGARRCARLGGAAARADRSAGAGGRGLRRRGRGGRRGGGGGRRRLCRGRRRGGRRPRGRR